MERWAREIESGCPGKGPSHSKHLDTDKDWSAYGEKLTEERHRN